MDAVAPDVVNWMYDGAIFCWLSDHSLRLVQGVDAMIERCFPKPCQGAPPDAERAKLFADELQALHCFHWMCIETDANSGDYSVDELFGPGKIRAKSYEKVCFP